MAAGAAARRPTRGRWAAGMSSSASPPPPPQSGYHAYDPQEEREPAPPPPQKVAAQQAIPTYQSTPMPAVPSGPTGQAWRNPGSADFYQQVRADVADVIGHANAAWEADAPVRAFHGRMASEPYLRENVEAAWRLDDDGGSGPVPFEFAVQEVQRIDEARQMAMSLSGSIRVVGPGALARGTAAVPTGGPDPVEVLQRLTDVHVAQITANPGLAGPRLSPLEQILPLLDSKLGPAMFGRALERLVARDVKTQYAQLLSYTGRGRGPDFKGLGPAVGEFSTSRRITDRQHTTHDPTAHIWS